MNAMTCERGDCTEHFHSVAEVQAHADTLAVPGPMVEEHAEGHDGPCFCKLCCSYMEG